MAEIIRVDGTRTPIAPKNGKDFKLEELQEIVGGYIEVCECTEKGKILVIDEEGKLNGKEPNWTATDLYKYAYASNGRLLDIIVGDVLYCDSKQVR